MSFATLRVNTCLALALAGWTLTSVAAPVAPSWQEAANATYSGVLGETIRFVDGTWQGEPYVAGGASASRAGLLKDFLLQGDVDGDGADDSVVLVWTSTGGSGTFDYIVALKRNADGSVSERASAPLGDRVQLRSGRIENGEIVLLTVQAGAGDAACCPGQKMRRTFALEEDTMKESSSEDQGRLSLADLAGNWKLQQFSFEEDVPADISITLQVDGDRIAGQAACNRYSGTVEEGDMPGDVALSGPLAVTRKMCPPPLMEWEQRYLQALGGLRKFGFVGGRLALSFMAEDAMGTLLFSPSGAEDEK